jgi:hypothetical protein
MYALVIVQLVTSADEGHLNIIFKALFSWLQVESELDVFEAIITWIEGSEVERSGYLASLIGNAPSLILSFPIAGAVLLASDRLFAFSFVLPICWFQWACLLISHNSMGDL